MSEDKKHLSIAVVGHVDAGKSTTTGRLIFELGGINERKMKELQKRADEEGKSSFAFAYFLDNTKEEQQKGVTIKTTTKEFFTDTKHYTILDNPGHSDYIKNMITGSSQADVGLIMVPADGNFTTAIAKGDHKKNEVVGQTRQHSLLLNLLGVKQIIVGINKMDCSVANYSEERYNEVRDEMMLMLTRVGWKKDFVKNVPMIPISGFKGDNLIKPSENMGWWKGVDVKVGDRKVHVHTLLDALEKMVDVPERNTEAPLRLPISGSFQIKGVGQVLTGRVEQGLVKPGMEVVFLPTHTVANPCKGKVFTVEMHHKNVPQAGPGDNVGMNIKNLNKDNMPQTGDIMVEISDKTLGQCKSFVTQVKILNHPGELKVGYTPIAFVRTSRAPVRMTEIRWKIGKETGGSKLENPSSLKAGEMAEVVFEPQGPFVVDSFKNCEGLGRVAVMEGNSVVMLGKAIEVEFK